MNNGNYEHGMVQTTRVHTTPKRVLHWDDEVIQQEENCDIRDYELFLKFINDFDSLSLAESTLTEGKWGLFYAIIRRFAESLSINYCVYENPAGLQFDVTTHGVVFKEASLVKVGETKAELLERLQLEKSQIDLKIVNLQKKREEVSDRILGLVKDLVGGSYDLVEKPVVSACG